MPVQTEAVAPPRCAEPRRTDPCQTWTLWHHGMGSSGFRVLCWRGAPEVPQGGDRRFFLRGVSQSLRQDDPYPPNRSIRGIHVAGAHSPSTPGQAEAPLGHGVRAFRSPIPALATAAAEVTLLGGRSSPSGGQGRVRAIHALAGSRWGSRGPHCRSPSVYGACRSSQAWTAFWISGSRPGAITGM